MSQVVEQVSLKAAQLVGSYYRAASCVIWIMLVSYTLPIFAVIYSAIATNGFSRTHFILGMFSSLVTTADDSYSIFHRVLVPLISAFSIVAFRDKGTSRNTMGLLIFILCAILCSIGLNLYVSSDAARKSIEALKGETFSLDVVAAKAFFNRMQEVLGTLLMMLLGLQISDSVKLKEG